MSIRKIKRKRGKTRSREVCKPEPGARLPADLNRELATASRYLHTGRFDQAAEICKRVLAVKPDHDYSLHMLGMIAREAGDKQAARDFFEHSIRVNPRQPAYYNNLGLLLMDLGQNERAVTVFDKALQIKPDIFEILSNKGNALKNMGRLTEASACYEKALPLNPDDPGIHLNLGNLRIKQNRIDAAVTCFKEAVRSRPNLAEAHNNLGNAFLAGLAYNEAISCYQEAIRLAPDFGEAYFSLGNTLRDDGKYSEAIEWFDKVRQLQPGDEKPYLFLGNSFFNLGEFAKATDYYHKALEIKPDFGEAARMLSLIRKYVSVEDSDVVSFNAILERDDLHEHDAMHLHFALGKIYDDCALYRQAFLHYQQGNRLHHMRHPWDRENFVASTERTISIFTPDFIKENQQGGSSAELPVFIVGMPRSGTSLVEQIISSHPRARGAGELKKMGALYSTIEKKYDKGASGRENIVSLSPAVLQSSAREYLEFLTRNISDNPLRITDKMPYNFLLLGLISILFPKARIIHCQRNPLDNCLSIYFQFFANMTPYAYDPATIGSYYLQDRRLMAHWRQALPANLLDVHYEDIIAAPDDMARKLIDFVGLDWDERCLTFYENSRLVRTASMWQVRQPVYKTSVNRWRNYEEFLGPFKEALGIE